MNSIIQIKDSKIPDRRLTGNKFFNLWQLNKNHIPVPDAFVITTEGFRRFLKYHSLENKVSSDDDLKKLRNFILQAEIPSSLIYEIELAYYSLNSRFVAVRSSGINEDSAEKSFAGMAESFLNIKGIQDLIKAVKGCWISAVNPEILEYQNKKNDFDYVLAVIIQVMVPSHISGVCFTSYPTADQLMIESTWGLGKVIADGIGDPDQIFIDKLEHALLSYHIGEKPFMYCSKIVKGIHKKKVPKVLRKRLCLYNGQQKQLAVICYKIEKLFGSRQDIEWAVTNDSIYILQSRPLKTKDDNGVYYWENIIKKSNWSRTWRLGEWLDKPLTPLFQTMVVPVLVNSREEGGTGIWGVNLPECWRLKRPAYKILNGYFYSRTDKDWRSFLRFMVIDIWSIEKKIQYWENKCIVKYHLEIESLKKINYKKYNNDEVLELAERICQYAGELWHKIALDGGGAGFIELVLSKIFTVCVDEQIDTSLLVRGDKTEQFSRQTELYYLYEKIREDCLLFEILTKEEPKYIVGYIRDNKNSSLACSMINDYITKYCICYELDFIAPVTNEDAEIFIKELKDMTNENLKKPHLILNDNKNLSILTEIQVGRQIKLPFLKRIINKMITRLRLLTVRRENSIYYFQELFPLLRKTLLILGDRMVRKGFLAEKEDIFFATAALLKNMLASAVNKDVVDDIRNNIIQRKKAYEVYLNLKPPNTIPRNNKKNGIQMHGKKIYQGSAKGYVRLIQSYKDLKDVEVGEIVVAISILPSWIPTLRRAGGVITESGGIASHSSILIREYGIPALTGVENITQIVSTGECILLNADEEVINILKS